jgi:hypothetical protein
VRYIDLPEDEITETINGASIATMNGLVYLMRKRWESNPHAVSRSPFSRRVPPPIGWPFHYPHYGLPLWGAENTVCYPAPF